MILDGVSYSAFIYLCRVILSRMMDPTVVSPQPDLLLVFNLILSGPDVCLDWYLRPIVFTPMLFKAHCLIPTATTSNTIEGKRDTIVWFKLTVPTSSCLAPFRATSSR